MQNSVLYNSFTYNGFPAKRRWHEFVPQERQIMHQEASKPTEEPFLTPVGHPMSFCGSVIFWTLKMQSCVQSSF